MTAVTDPTAGIVDAYFALWEVPDPEPRFAVIAEVFTDDCRYADPQVDVRGHAAFAAYVEQVLDQVGPARFARTSPIDSHHGLVRFTWSLAAPGGPALLSGTDVLVLAGDRIASFFGFFDR